jgi:cephalosporin hydroxylase
MAGGLDVRARPVAEILCRPAEESVKTRYADMARQFVRPYLPAAVVERYGRANLIRQARKLAALAGRAATTEDRWDTISRFTEFYAYQKRQEILPFLERVARLQPQRLCEIGAASGGTLCALSHAATESALVISLDFDFTPARLKALPQLGRPRQTVVCIAGDSHDANIHSRVGGLLGGERLDLLFIDGDHSYAGVKADFEMYAGFVRNGGLIGFHDIVPDYKARYGTPTPADSGGVPAFWQEIKARFRDTQEFVESPAQDGYGIGLLTWGG